MKTIVLFVGCALATALVAPTLITSTPEAKGGFSLAGTIPDDVFLCVAERHNPEREFIDHYWGEVIEALAQSGIGEDLTGLVGSLLGVEQTAEIERLKERASQLLAGVDYERLAGKEMVFAERFEPPVLVSNGRPPILIANMVWLFRGSGEGAAQNYEGLVAVLEALANEVNKAVGTEALAVDRSTRMGAKVAGVNMLAMVPGAPALPLSVALRDEVVIIALREHLLADVLDLMNGSSTKKVLADSSRFKTAFAQLPPAEDSMTFFDMQALLKPIRGFVDAIIDLIGAPGDVYRRTGMSAQANKVNTRALGAYQRGDVEQALALTKQAYNAAPEDSIVLYNLACFNALLGNRNEALAWLEKAVEGGFYAPRKIASDGDLASLRGEPKYKAALAKAAELAAECHANDIVINGAKTGEAFTLLLQVHQAYQEKDYEQGLKLSEQAHAVAPKHSRVLYALACFHALLGHEDKALDFLEEAVDGGFYCPQHISKDPDWENIRGHERYKTVVAKARQKAGELTARKEGDKTALAKRLIDRLVDAVGVLDYSATVETTDGYAVRAESIIALVPDAKSTPVYPVFGKRPQLKDFDRYLPQETRSFSVAGGFDIGELYKFLEDSVRLAGPKGEELLTKWTGVQEMLGMNVRKDVIGWIDGDSISVTLDDGNWVWMIKVTNGEVAREKVTTAIEFLSTKLPEAAAKNPALVGLAMMTVRSSPLEHEQLDGFADLYIGMSPQPVVWGIADSYLVFSGSADAVARCLATARGEHPNIRSNTRAMNEAIVPSGTFTSVSLTDQRGMGEELAAGLGVASMVSGMMGAFVPEPKLRPVLAKISGMLTKLTPVVRKIDFYKSKASHTTFDGQTWRSRGVTHYFSPAEHAAHDAGKPTSPTGL